MWNSPRRKSAVAGVIVIVLLGVLLGGSAVANAGEVLGGITVGGIPVGGLTGEQLVTRLAPAARAMQVRPITLYAGKREWTLSPEAMGITVDLEATARRAFMAGRSNSITWLLQSLGSREQRLTWVTKVDRARMAQALRELSSRVNVEASNGNVTLAGSDVRVKAPTEGVRLRSGQARQRLVGAAVNPARGDRVRLPVTTTTPEIGQEEAVRIQQQAQGILRAPVEFIWSSRSFTLSAERVASALRVRVVEDPKTSSASLLLQADAAALKEQIIASAPFVKKASKDASFSVRGDSVILNPGQEGSTIDTSEAANALLALKDSSRRPINLPVVVEPPAFSTEQAQALKITSKIATFTTPFDSRNVPRVANIDRMASAIDGKLLRPGQAFSLNGATGARTPANGYQEAQVIVDGELVPGIGGGVCQVATTLFNAVFTAGLDVVERVNHSLHISKYPMGRDATVNYGAQDFRFRNDTEFGLLLKASVSSKGMTVSIFSSPLGRTVEESTSPTRNPKPAPTKVIEDPSLPAGVEKVEEPGTPGFDVTVTRKVTSGGRVLHSDTFVSKYSPWKRIVKKGTGPAAKPAPPPAEDVFSPNPT
ncbi:MAG TPA: VanW family protein [Actinomycetota bacterium]|nr:VanW family protein [Actinomycetota bacterium]